MTDVGHFNSNCVYDDHSNDHAGSWRCCERQGNAMRSQEPCDAGTSAGILEHG
jgi:hypothetical protein